jgi:hypothetical protein
MALILSELRTALQDAGVSPAQAEKAAAEVAGYQKIGEIGAEIARLRTDLTGQVEKLRTDLTAQIDGCRAETGLLKADMVLMKWMIGAVFGLQVGCFWLLFTLLQKTH